MMIDDNNNGKKVGKFTLDTDMNEIDITYENILGIASITRHNAIDEIDSLDNMWALRIYVLRKDVFLIDDRIDEI